VNAIAILPALVKVDAQFPFLSDVLGHPSRLRRHITPPPFHDARLVASQFLPAGSGVAIRQLFQTSTARPIYYIYYIIVQLLKAALPWQSFNRSPNIYCC
jgi:hypothetical protein